jgi:hypothetical protein
MSDDRRNGFDRLMQVGVDGLIAAALIGCAALGVVLGLFGALAVIR